MPISDHDRDMMIRTVMGVAGDQSDPAQSAYAHVILNRTKTGLWGDSPSGVVLARNQFEPWSTRGKELRTIDAKSKDYQRTAAIVDAAVSGAVEDPTGGATHFDAGGKRPRGQQSPLRTAENIVAIGDHKFGQPREFSAALGYSDEKPGNGVPDLLGDLIRGASAKAPTGPAGAPPAAPTAAPVPDILGDLVRAAPQGAPAKPAPLASDPPAPGATREFTDLEKQIVGPNAGRASVPAGRVAGGFDALERSQQPQQETLPQATNRWMRENQGNTWSEGAARLGVGALRGMGDVGDTLAQGITSVGRKGSNALAQYGVISPQTRQSVHGWADDVDSGIRGEQAGYDTAANDSTAASIGRVGGQVAATAPLIMATQGRILSAAPAPVVNALAARPIVSSVLGGAVTGGATNALTSSTSSAPLLDQMKEGAMWGGAMGPVAHAGTQLGSHLFGGAIDRTTAGLAQLARNRFGIDVTAGQISANPTVRFLDSVLQRLPFTGYGTRTANQQGAFNAAVAHTFGEASDKITPDVMARARDRIGNVFETTLPRLESHLNPQVQARLQGVVDAADYLPAEDARIIHKHVNDIIQQFTGVNGVTGRPLTYSNPPRGPGRMDGGQIQAMIARDSPLDRAIRGGSSNVKNYAAELKDILLDSVAQTPTGRQKTAAAYVERLRQYQQARFQYKNMKTVEDLAEKSPTGDLSPALLMGAARKSFDQMAYGGGGDIADLARIGQRFLKEPPSSGTAERLTIMQHLPQMAIGATGVGALGVAQHFDPDSWQRNALVATGLLGAGRAGGSALRSDWMANALIRSGMRGRQPWPVARSVNYTVPAAGALISRDSNPLALPPPR